MDMKNHALLSISMVFVLLAATNGLRPRHHTSVGGERIGEEVGSIENRDHHHHQGARMELYPTGSSIPDCSHACGPCNPCKRVMVSFRCLSPESCPVVYRCTCNGRYYHVPSN